METHQLKKWGLCETQSETKTLSAFWCTCSAPLVHVTATRLIFLCFHPHHFNSSSAIKVVGMDFLLIYGRLNNRGKMRHITCVVV